MLVNNKLGLTEKILRNAFGQKAPIHSLKDELLGKLRTIEGVQSMPSPVLGGTALFFAGKAFGHFHSDNELDLKLTKKRLRALGLTHPSGSIHHPSRSPNSAWIELRFKDLTDVTRIRDLVKIAISEL